jgi:hypothetical protein
MLRGMAFESKVLRDADFRRVYVALAGI